MNCNKIFFLFFSINIFSQEMFIGFSDKFEELTEHKVILIDDFFIESQLNSAQEIELGKIQALIDNDKFSIDYEYQDYFHFYPLFKYTSGNGSMLFFVLERFIDSNYLEDRVIVFSEKEGGFNAFSHVYFKSNIDKKLNHACLFSDSIFLVYANWYNKFKKVTFNGEEFDFSYSDEQELNDEMIELLLNYKRKEKIKIDEKLIKSDVQLLSIKSFELKSNKENFNKGDNYYIGNLYYDGGVELYFLNKITDSIKSVKRIISVRYDEKLNVISQSIHSEYATESEVYKSLGDLDVW